MNNREIAFNDNNIVKAIKKVKENAERRIIDGINNPLSSTGMPINKLFGAANTTAVLANIGGGAKRIGGNGMQGGILTIRQYDTANTYLKTTSNINSLSRKLITFEQLLK